jgi:hypothetical protein
VSRTQTGEFSLSNTALHAVTDPEYYGITLGSGDPVRQEFLNRVDEGLPWSGRFRRAGLTGHGGCRHDDSTRTTP